MSGSRVTTTMGGRTSPEIGRGARSGEGGGPGSGRGIGGGAGGGGAPAQEAPPQAAPGGPVFALTLLQINPATFIDYSTATGTKLLQLIMEALSIIFDADSKQVNLFCKALQDRAKKSGWDLARDNMITISDTNSQNCNLILQQAQNSVQLYHCLKNSITDTAKLKILAETEKYIVTGYQLGKLLFKLLMQKAVIDTGATANFSYFRLNL
eukprot:15326237-Ditylum_brightwellii.AAC.1